uniref:Biogenesis of lysosomal organelles complex 1 subunit 4 n=1 Tax=Anolis carolinensis TaxID=28377 RepID=G1K9C8_ANOCA
QIETLDKGLEDLLTRVDEFVGMLDMIRSDSSQVVNENVPHIHAKAVEMRQLYRKIDKLEAFVKMVGNSVSGMEEQITKAESDLGTFPNTFKKLLHTINVPSFLNPNSISCSCIPCRCLLIKCHSVFPVALFFKLDVQTAGYSDYICIL